MKTTKITYWISTILISLLFLYSAFLYLSHDPAIIEKFKLLGYPDYLLSMLATAKILAVLALLVPTFPRLKEWAYAGLVIDLAGALWSHAAVHDIKGFGVLIPFVVLIISYVSFRKLQSAPETELT